MTTELSNGTGEAAEGRFRYRLSGDGPNVLLVSGLNGQSRFWNAVHGGLSEHYRILSFDQRGCGETPDDGAEWTIETLAADAFALADAVFGRQPFAVIGHSTGGAIAQCMVAAQPGRIPAVVLSGTWICADGYMRALFNLRLSLLSRAPDLDPVLGNLLRMPPEAFSEADDHVMPDRNVTCRRIHALIAHHGEDFVPHITQPALVMGAEDDRIVPPHLVRELHAGLADSTLSILPDGGHFYPQTRPDLFGTRVTDWLGRALPTPHGRSRR